VLIDFGTIPGRQIGSYANNLIPADQFAFELRRQGDLFGTCLIAPEKNSESGGSCLTTLKVICPIDPIYRQAPNDNISDWTKDDLRELKAHSRAKTPVAKISKMTKRSESALREKAFSLGLALGHQR
jgi:hypothetical protein